MPFILILVLLSLVTESFVTTWYSAAINAKVKEKLTFLMPVILSVVKTAALALGIFIGLKGSVMIPWFYLTMAYVLMFIIGLKMVIETMRFSPEERIILIDNNKTILLLGIAGSFNTFFVGLSLGLIGSVILHPVVFTFIGTLVLSILAFFLGKKYGLKVFLRITGIIAGALICVIALRFFVLYYIN